MKRKIAAMFMALFVMCSVTVESVGAVAWSWTTGPAKLYGNDPAVVTADYCPTFRQSFEVVGVGEQDLCLFQGQQLQFASLLNVQGKPMAAAKFTYDSKFLPVDGVCQVMMDCYYSGATDRLVMRTYIPGSWNQTIVVYDRVSQRLRLGIDYVNGYVRYEFDTQQPSYQTNDVVGTALSTGSFAVSENGRWLAVELIGRGIGLVNLESGTMRRITAEGYQYHMGFDPHEELAVTNDGKTVAVTGYNAGLRLYAVNDTCGDTPMIPLERTLEEGADRCQEIAIDSSTWTNGFLSGHRPKFDVGGGEFSLTVRQHEGGTRRMVFRASGYEGSPRIGYLALGDSFTNGEGETDDAYYIAGTNDPYEKCHTSRRSYPFLVAETLDTLNIGTASVACSGARSVDVVGSNEDYWGQGDRLGGAGKQLTAAQREQTQASAMQSMMPGRIHQASFVRDRQPSVVTIGIGGNDAGMMDKVKACAMPGTCEWAASSEGLEKTAIEIRGLYGTLLSMYKQLKTEAPQAHFYTVGYPNVISPRDQCDVVTDILLNSDEREFLNQSLRFLNQIIRAASHAAGIQYLDIEQSFAGHELCSGSTTPAMNGLRLGDDIAPIGQLPILKLIGNETFHPTPYGHQLMAQLIKAHYELLPIECGCEDAAPPSPSAYWLPDGVTHDYPRSIAADFVQEERTHVGQRTITVRMPAGSFVSGGGTWMTVGSEAIDVGWWPANLDGSLEVTAEIPVDLEEGYHSVHLYGWAPGGDVIDLYEVVQHGESVEVSTQNVAQDVPLFPILEMHHQARTNPDNSSWNSLAGDMKVDKGDSFIEQLAPTGGVLGARTEVAEADKVGKGLGYWLQLMGVGAILVGIAGIIWVIMSRRRQ